MGHPIALSGALSLLLLASARATALSSSTTRTAAVGTTYRALMATGVGDQFRDVAQIAELPMPELAEDEVLVKVVYSWSSSLVLEGFPSSSVHCSHPYRHR